MNPATRDMIERAAWTAAQSAIATFMVTQDFKAVAAAGIAAGLSVVKTFAKQRLQKEPVQP